MGQKKQRLKWPDGNGGYDIRHFETSVELVVGLLEYIRQINRTIFRMREYTEYGVAKYELEVGEGEGEEGVLIHKKVEGEANHKVEEWVYELEDGSTVNAVGGVEYELEDGEKYEYTTYKQEAEVVETQTRQEASERQVRMYEVSDEEIIELVRNAKLEES